MEDDTFPRSRSLLSVASSRAQCTELQFKVSNRDPEKIKEREKKESKSKLVKKKKTNSNKKWEQAPLIMVFFNYYMVSCYSKRE